MTHRDFTPGDIFTADDADLLMRQGLIIVANATERNAIPAPEEGMRVYNRATKRVEHYDGTAWQTSAWQTVAAGAGFTGDIRFAVLGGDVEIRSSLIGSCPDGNSTAGTNVIPAGLRPTLVNAQGAAYFGGGWPGVAICDTNGTITITQRTGATRSNPFFTIRYALN